MRTACFTLFLSLFSLLAMAQDKRDTSMKKHDHAKHGEPAFEIPSSLKAEHKELHQQLLRFTKMPGRTGTEARAVADVLHPHFVKEEEYALPQLGLLVRLSKGEADSSMHRAIEMSERLKEEWEEMLAEHREITKALDKLKEAARAENKTEVIRFADALKLHAQTEEQVLYPASILIGEYLKLKMGH